MRKIKYFVTADNHSIYKVDYDNVKIIRICNNKMTYPTFDKVAEIETYNKANINRWNEVKNVYYRSTYFEWFYNGDAYETCGPAFSEEMLVKNTQPSPGGRFGESSYHYLCFHNGEIWATNYDLSALHGIPCVDINGKVCCKWTNVNNCRNFQKKVDG